MNRMPVSKVTNGFLIELTLSRQGKKRSISNLCFLCVIFLYLTLRLEDTKIFYNISLCVSVPWCDLFLLIMIAISFIAVIFQKRIRENSCYP